MPRGGWAGIFQGAEIRERHLSQVCWPAGAPCQVAVRQEENSPQAEASRPSALAPGKTTMNYEKIYHGECRAQEKFTEIPKTY